MLLTICINKQTQHSIWSNTVCGESSSCKYYCGSYLTA